MTEQTCPNHIEMIRDIQSAQTSVENVEKYSLTIAKQVQSLNSKFDKLTGELNGSIPVIKDAIEKLGNEAKSMQESKQEVAVQASKIQDIEKDVDEKVGEKEFKAIIESMEKLHKSTNEKFAFWIKIFGGVSALGVFIGGITVSAIWIIQAVK